MPKRTSKTGSKLFIVDNSYADWKVLRYLHDGCHSFKAIDIATGSFEIGSLRGLKDEWQKVDQIRVLLGEVTRRTKAAFAEGLARRLSQGRRRRRPTPHGRFRLGPQGTPRRAGAVAGRVRRDEAEPEVAGRGGPRRGHLRGRSRQGPRQEEAAERRGVKALKDEHARGVPPLQALAAEARQLERRVADLVNAAYGLTGEDVALMWRTAPPRMPGEPPR
jgi:hypothetical protein